MVQLSSKPLNKNIKNRMFELFWRSIARLKYPQDACEFFTDLLTKSEQIMLAKRYTIAILLAKGHSRLNISQMIHVSTSTIANVANWLTKLNPRTKKIIKKHLQDETWRQFLDRLESLLDSLPPILYHPRKWSSVDKEKSQRQKSRIIRKSLR